MKSARASAAIRSLCGLGLPAEQLMPALLEALHGVVPSYRNLFDWTDEHAQLVRYFVEGPIDTRIAALYFDEFHNRREAEAMAPFALLSRLPAGVRAAHEIDAARFYRSALYHEVWKPQGFHSRLEAVLRGRGGQLLGSLVLYRAPGDAAFDAADARRLAELLPAIADAVQACGRAEADERQLPAPGAAETLLLALDGTVCHASAGAHALLLLSEGGVSRDRLSRPLHVLGDGVLPRLMARLRERAAAGAGPQPGSARVELLQSTPAGLLLAAGRLLAPLQPGAAPLVQVTLRRLEPQRVALERALRTLDLTPGQVAVCRELFHGHAQAEVARRLGVAPATVVDHVRKLYLALGLRSAGELRAMLQARLGAGGAA